MATGIVCEAVPDGNLVCVSCSGPLPPYSGKGRYRKRCVQCSPVNQALTSRTRAGTAQTQYSKTCVICALGFQTVTKATNTCGVGCGRVLQRRSLMERKNVEKARVCEYCSVAFREGVRSKKQLDAGQKQKFCSRRCGFDAKRAYTQKRLEAEGPKPKPQRPAPPSKACVRCGVLFIPSSHNAKKCIPCRETKAVPVTKPCEDCGTTVTGNAATRRCKPCSIKRGRLAFKARHGSGNKNRHRARRFGVEYEPINPIEVFERDGWKCHICGKQTPKARRGSYRSNAPELDHIVAMSLGGSHTKGNVACACRACNGAKGARAFGQPSLLSSLMAGGGGKSLGR